MKIIVFEYSRGWNDDITEEFEYEDDILDDVIEKEYQDWVWEIIGDNCNWYEKED